MKTNVRTKTLLACGLIGGPLFVATFLVEGATRTNYDPLRHPISSLALGDSGWTQTANFIVAGLLTLVFAAGLRRVLRPGKGSTWGPLLVGIWAVGLLGAGIFVTDPVNGYPPGRPDRAVQYSWHGALHDLLSLLAFVALATACFVVGRWFTRQGERGWEIYSAVSGVVFAVAFALSSAGFGQAAGLVDLAGLFQRVAVAIGFCWLTVNPCVIPVSDPVVTPRRGRSTWPEVRTRDLKRWLTFRNYTHSEPRFHALLTEGASKLTLV